MANLGPKGIKWDADELRSLYEEQGLSSVDIAKFKGVHPTAVTYQLRKLGIRARSPVEAAVRGDRHPFYKGSKFKGYYRSNLGGRKQLEHRRIAERALGRSLGVEEVVHHCNDDKADNRPENLWVFPSQSDHMRFHSKGIIHPDTIFLKDYQ
jgi:hypothetical protein